MALTKQDIEAIGGLIDVKLAPIQKNILDIKHDLSGLREQIQQLTITLDKFVKMMTDYKEEFAILKAEVDQMKKVFKEKLGVEIAVQK